jgi:hypothetical protein
LENSTNPAPLQPKSLPDCKQLKDFADYYETSLTRVKRLKKLGVNLHDPNEVAILKDRRNLPQVLADYRASLTPGSGSNRPDTSPAPDFTLKDSLQALRRAEGILSKAFEAADPARRSLALQEWLKVQDARVKLEIQIHEAEKLGAESLPVDEVKREWFAALQKYREELESIPAKWAVFLFEKPEWECQEILKGLAAQLINRHLAA